MFFTDLELAVYKEELEASNYILRCVDECIVLIRRLEAKNPEIASKYFDLDRIQLYFKQIDKRDFLQRKLFWIRLNEDLKNFLEYYNFSSSKEALPHYLGVSGKSAGTARFSGRDVPKKINVDDLEL